LKEESENAEMEKRISSGMFSGRFSLISRMSWREMEGFEKIERERFCQMGWETGQISRVRISTIFSTGRVGTAPIQEE
jgi:hypothetical protein